MSSIECLAAVATTADNSVVEPFPNDDDWTVISHTIVTTRDDSDEGESSENSESCESCENSDSEDDFIPSDDSDGSVDSGSDKTPVNLMRRPTEAPGAPLRRSRRLFEAAAQIEDEEAGSAQVRNEQTERNTRRRIAV